MWVPGRPAVRADEHGFLTWAREECGRLPSPLQTWTVPSVRQVSTARPSRKAWACSLMISSALAASGLVSMAVTKMARGAEPRAGTFAERTGTQRGPLA